MQSGPVHAKYPQSTVGFCLQAPMHPRSGVADILASARSSPKSSSEPATGKVNPLASDPRFTQFKFSVTDGFNLNTRSAVTAVPQHFGDKRGGRGRIRRRSYSSGYSGKWLFWGTEILNIWSWHQFWRGSRLWKKKKKTRLFPSLFFDYYNGWLCHFLTIFSLLLFLEPSLQDSLIYIVLADTACFLRLDCFKLKGIFSTLCQALISILVVHQINIVLWAVGECLHLMSLMSNISLSTSLLQTHRRPS